MNCALRIRLRAAMIGAGAVLVIVAACRTPGWVRAAEVGGLDGAWQVYFSPEGGCTQAIVQAIGGARQQVLVQATS